MNGIRTRLRTTRISFILFTAVIALTATTAETASVTLGWDPTDPTPEGYRVFSRKADEAYDYSQPDWEGEAGSCKLADLEDETIYCFTVRAYAGDRESTDSNEACFIPPDSDYDSDGMPDDWEFSFGLDLLVDDADDDADNDGISNRDEYRAGLEPDYAGEGTAPSPPVSLFPESDDEADLNPLLAVDDFSDSEGDAHTATQWQLFDTLTDACLMDVVTDRRLTGLRVPLLLLTGDKRYHWRVRFFDSGGRPSAWSAESRFTTQPAIDDADGNGIPDDQEGDMLKADGNRSAGVTTAYGELTSVAVASEDTVSEIERAMLADPSDFDIDETTPPRLPSAMAAYKLLLDQPGQRALVTIHLSDPAPTGSKWLRYDGVNGWQDYAEFAILSPDRRSVTLETEDGGYGDADGVANGIIVDAAGLQQPVSEDSLTTTDTGEEAGGGAGEEAGEVSSESTSEEDKAVAGGAGSGGCFISSVGHALDFSR